MIAPAARISSATKVRFSARCVSPMCPASTTSARLGPELWPTFRNAAHVYGHPHVWTEAGGGLGQSGKFVADYQLVRGVNYLNIRGLNAGVGTAGPALLNAAAATAAYVGRAGYLLAVGRPAAQVALLHPTDSMWLGDQEADKVTVKLTTQLLEHQIAFDAMDAEAIASVCTLEGGGLKNLSGQTYRAVIVPTGTAISAALLERLRAFAATGGKVVFIGRTSTLVYGRDFLHAETSAPDLKFAALLEPAAELTARVLAVLPKDVTLDASCPAVKYARRALADGDVYFFFNESAETVACTATLAGRGDVQVWSATTGAIQPLAGAGPARGTATVPLVFAPHESRIIVIGPPVRGAAPPAPARTSAEAIAVLEGAWSIAIGDKRTTGPLVSWQELGVGSFEGLAIYEKSFTAPAALPAGRRVFLDLGSVREVARVKLNQKELPALPWAPHVWDVTDALQPGTNTLTVEVQVPLGASRGFGGGGGRGARAGVTTAAAPRSIAPTGVPGGLAADAMLAASGRGGRGGAPTGLAGGEAAAPASPPAALGLLGPVRLLAP